MTSERRLTLLKIAAATMVGVWALNAVVVGPMVTSWRQQGERIGKLRKQTEQGQMLLDRADALRERWEELQEQDLPPDVAEAENTLFKAVARWARESQLTFTALNPQWRSHEEGYETLDCRASAVGTQSGVARFLQELEQDPLAVRLDSCEISARDAAGSQLLLTLKFSGLRLGTGASGVAQP